MFSQHKRQHSRFPSINGFVPAEQSETQKDDTLQNLCFTSDEKIKQEKVSILKAKIDELQSLLYETNKENQTLIKLNKTLTDALKGVNEDIQKIFAVKGDEEEQVLAFNQSIENKPCEILERIKILENKIEMQETTPNQYDSPRFKKHKNYRDKVSLLSYRNSYEHQKPQDYHKGFTTINIPNERKSSIDYVKNNDVQTKKILTYSNTPIIPDNLSSPTNLTKDKRVKCNQSESLNVKLSDRKNSNNRQELNFQFSPINKNIIATSDELPLCSKMRIAGSINLAHNLSLRTKQSPKSPRNYLINQPKERKLIHNKSSDYIMKQSIQEIWAKAQPKLLRQNSQELTDSYYNHSKTKILQQKSPRRLNQQTKKKRQLIEYNKFTNFSSKNEKYVNFDNLGKSYLNFQLQPKTNLNEDISFSNRSYLALKIKSPRDLNQKSTFMKSGKRLLC